MAVDNKNVIDFLGMDDERNEVILTVSDHLDWKNKWDHLLTLQAKINAYLDFIADGEIYDLNSNARNKKITIEIIGKYDLPKDDDISKFFQKVDDLLSNFDVSIRFKNL